MASPGLTAKAAFVLAFLLGAGTAQAETLSGHVRSAEEGAMEGVLVSAHRDGSNITVTVVTDTEGRYAFPAARLAPGHYTLAIRAVGYDLAGPNAADIAANTPATADLTLRKTADLAAQLTNAEWMESLPGGADQKQFLQNCTNCHSLHQPLFSNHTADEFVDVQQRMAHYSAASSLLLPQPLVADRVTNQGEFMLEKRKDAIQKQATYLASVNLSKSETWNFPLKTFPRPTGRATHVVITEYDLPEPTRMPHDVIVAKDGTVWYDSFAEQILGKLDPKTGKTVEYTIPTLQPDGPKGSLALRTDPDGNLWIGMAFQRAVARFDPENGNVQGLSGPAGIEQGLHADHRGGTDARQCGRQSVGRGFRHLFDLPGRCGERQVRGVPAVPDSQPEPVRHLQRRAEQCVFHGVRAQRHRPDRCEDRCGQDMADSHARFAAAPRRAGCHRKDVVRRIPWRQIRHVRYHD